MSGRTNPYDIESVKGYPNALQVYRIPASSKWQVRLFVDRKYRRKSTGCVEKRDAIEFAKRFYDEIKIAQRLDFDVHRDTFAACAAQLMKRQESLVATGQRNERILSEDRKKLDADILPFFKTMAVSEITASTLDDYVATIGKRQLSPSTISKHLVVIRKVLLQAQRQGYIKSLPVFPSVRRKDNPRAYFEFQETKVLLKTAKTLADECIKVRGVPLTLSFRDFIQFHITSFLRISDLKILKHRDIKVHTATIDGQRQRYLGIVPTNSKTVNRESYTMPQALKPYERLKNRYEALGLAEPDDYVFFPQFRNRQYALDTMRRQFEFIVQKADLKTDRYGNARTLYSLRHTALMLRFLTGDKLDIFSLAKNALTSVNQLERFYLSHVDSRQRIDQLMSLRKPASAS